MDQKTYLNEQTENGKRLIEALAADGFDVRVAFWAKPTEDGRWYLYLASQVVDKEGSTVAYRRVDETMRKIADLWIDPLAIKVVGLNDSLTEAALKVLEPKALEGAFAVQPPKPYPGMTHFGGSLLGGVNIDGAWLYPLYPAATE